MAVWADDGTVWLLGGDVPVRLSGRLAAPVARTIDGARSLDACAAAAADEGVDPMTAYVVLQAWWRSGHLAEVAGAGPGVRVVGDDGALAAALVTAGVATSATGIPVVVLDHLTDAADVEVGSPWLPVVVRGPRVLVGPLVGPGAACARCLEARAAERSRVALTAARLAGLAGLPRAPRREAAPALAAGVIAADLRARAEGVTPTLTDGRCHSVDVRTLESRSHLLVPVPGCPDCDPGGISLAASAEGASGPVAADTGGLRTVDPEATWRAYRHLVSEVIGLVPVVRPQEPAALRVYHAGANPVVSDGLDLDGLRSTLRAGAGGKGVTEAAARAGALAEAIERRSMRWVGDEPVVRARFTSLDSAVHPNAIQLFSFDQLQAADADPAAFAREPERAGFHRVPRTFDESAERDWVWARPLAGGDPVLIAASLAFLAHPDGREGGVRACSNGVAAGNTREEALLQGLLELVERDAVALWWYPRAHRPAIDVHASDDPRVRAALSPLEAMGRDVWVLDLTTDLGIPAAAAVSARTDGTRLLHGFGAHVDPVLAVVRAITEAAQMESAAEAGEALSQEQDPTSLEQRWVHEVTRATDPWLAPHGFVPLAGDAPKAIDEALDLLSRRLAEAGLTPYWLDLTRADTRLPVVRAVVPGLRHFWNRFAPGRLYDVPPRLGWVEPGYGEEELNPRWVFI